MGVVTAASSWGRMSIRGSQLRRPKSPWCIVVGITQARWGGDTRQWAGGRRLKGHPREWGGWCPTNPPHRDPSWSVAPLLSVLTLHLPALQPRKGASAQVRGGDLDQRATQGIPEQRQQPPTDSVTVPERPGRQACLPSTGDRLSQPLLRDTTSRLLRPEGNKPNRPCPDGPEDPRGQKPVCFIRSLTGDFPSGPLSTFQRRSIFTGVT